eukprot:g29884.t1
MDGKAPKALMRLGLGLLRTGKPGPASDWLAAAQKAMPKDSEVRRLLREAEMKRSPTWVCANGCCGPWGIVCGGPSVDTMAERVGWRPALLTVLLLLAGPSFVGRTTQQVLVRRPAPLVLHAPGTTPAVAALVRQRRTGISQGKQWEQLEARCSRCLAAIPY